MLGSPPPLRAAMMIARLSLLQSLPRLASMAPFLCLIVAQWEWPDMAPPSDGSAVCQAPTRRPSTPIEIVPPAPGRAAFFATPDGVRLFYALCPARNSPTPFPTPPAP